MKFCIFLCFFTFTILISNAQTNSTDFKTGLAGSAEKAISDDDVSGSPYKYEEFSTANVYLVLNDKPIEYKINYNLYKENLEYIEDDIRYTVMNPNKIVKVEINEEILVYAQYKNYDQNEVGYFFELIDDYISLYRREFISYIHSQRTFNNYGVPEKDKFAHKTTLFYLSIYGNPLILIKNKRALNKFFYNHPALKEYIKNEKLKLNSEDDLKKLVVFLNDYEKAQMSKRKNNR